jgi:hypothetical protein
MQSRFGHDFSQVRIHSDARATEAARAVGALGFTVGEDVVLAAGRYAPHKQEGQQLLAHELAHVVQQSSASNLAPGEQLRTVASEGALETEADISVFCLSRAKGGERSVAPTFLHPATRLGTVAIQRRREGDVPNPGAKRAKAAEQLVEKLKAAGAVYKQEPQRDWQNEKLSDCSKFVQWALEASGEGELFGRKNARTSAMREIITKLSVEDKIPFRMTDPKVGDILMWEGHVGIATEVVQRKDVQYLVFAHMGSSGPRLIGKSESSQDPSYWLKANDLAKIDGMGAGAFLGFWTP